MTLETANRERVGRALDLARDGLRPFVERCEQAIELCGFDPREFGGETR